MFFRGNSYANVTATLALFIALGGTSYAAVMVTGSDVKNGSLTGRDVKKNSLNGRDVQGIEGWDIADGAVKSRDIADHSIMASDLHASALFAGSKGAAGATGAKGEAGAAGKDGADGAKGDTGAAGADGSAIVNRTRSTGPTTATTSTAVPIPLTGNSWTQAADEVDQLVGVASVTAPADCAPRFEGMAYGSIHVMQSVNGGNAIRVGHGFLDASGEVALQFNPQVSHFEPGSAAENTLTATVSDECQSGHFTLDSLKVDVIAAR